MHFRSIVGIVVLACSFTIACGQDKGPPKISDAQRAAYWKAQSEAVATQAPFQKAQAALNAVIAEMTAVCKAGKTEIAPGTNGDPVCVAPKQSEPSKEKK